MSEAISAPLPFGANSTQMHANLTIGHAADSWAVGMCKGKPRPSSGGNEAPSLVCMKAIYHFNCALESSDYHPLMVATSGPTLEAGVP